MLSKLCGLLPTNPCFVQLLFLEPRYIQEEQTNQAEEVEEEDLFGGFSKHVSFFFFVRVSFLCFCC